MTDKPRNPMAEATAMILMGCIIVIALAGTIAAVRWLLL